MADPIVKPEDDEGENRSARHPQVHPFQRRAIWRLARNGCLAGLDRNTAYQRFDAELPTVLRGKGGDSVGKILTLSAAIRLPTAIGQRLDFRPDSDLITRNALLTTLLLDTNQLLQTLNGIGFRVSDRGPLIFECEDRKSPENSGDLTTLISKARNVACHRESDLQRMNEMVTVSFVWVAPGSAPIRMVVIETPDGIREPEGGRNTLGNETPDDWKVVFGGVELFMKNNIARALESAADRVLEYAATLP
jgi:hypothetical protein